MSPSPKSFAAWRRLPAALAVSSALLTSCASSSPAEPLAAPPGYEAAVDHFAGSLLSGPIPGATLPAGDVQAGFGITVRLYLVIGVERVADLADDGDLELTPIEDAIAFVADSGASTPIALASRTLAGGVVAQGEPARELLRLVAALPPAEAIELGDASDVVLPGVSTAFEASASGARLAIAVRGTDERGADVSLEVTRAGSDAELVKLAPSLQSDGGALLLAFPSPFVSQPRLGCVAFLELASPPADAAERAAHDERTTKALADVAAAAALPIATPSAAPVRDSVAVAALREVKPGPAARAALVQAAAGLGAEILAELAVSMDDDELASLVARFDAARPALLELAPVELPWAVEREAWRHLAARALEAELAPELSALLLRHAGAAGEWPTLVEDLATASADAAAFDAALVKENVARLGDRSASVRARAFDWLEARGAAPDGYDPLASAEARRAALAHE